MIGMFDIILGFVLLLVAMFLGLHVGIVILLISFVGAISFIGFGPIMAFGNQTWSYLNNSTLTAVPLFILLGDLLLRAGLSERMFGALADWTRVLPGRLLHTNVVASGLFSAVCGSSVATAATIGTIAIDDLERRKYDQRLVLGSIAAGGTLGILLPPSISMIIYGAMTNSSIGRLFMAGVVPGLLLMVLFIAAIAVIAIMRPGVTGRSDPLDPMRVRIKRLVNLLPPLAIFAITMIVIYMGLGTPTEAAAISVVLALIFAAAVGKLNVQFLHAVFNSSMRLTAMIMFILMSALFLNFVMGFLGVPRTLLAYVEAIELTAFQTILILMAFYFVLGLFMEALAMMVATLPIVFPLVTFVGIDPIWFGIFLVVMMEVALVTPPLGLNLYVVQGVRKKGSIADVFLGVLPFIVCMFVLVALIIIFPKIVTWLPDLLFSS